LESQLPIISVFIYVLQDVADDNCWNLNEQRSWAQILPRNHGTHSNEGRQKKGRIKMRKQIKSPLKELHHCQDTISVYNVWFLGSLWPHTYTHTHTHKGTRQVIRKGQTPQLWPKSLWSTAVLSLILSVMWKAQTAICVSDSQLIISLLSRNWKSLGKFERNKQAWSSIFHIKIKKLKNFLIVLRKLLFFLKEFLSNALYFGDNMNKDTIRHIVRVTWPFVCFGFIKWQKL